MRVMFLCIIEEMWLNSFIARLRSVTALFFASDEHGIAGSEDENGFTSGEGQCFSCRFPLAGGTKGRMWTFTWHLIRSPCPCQKTRMSVHLLILGVTKYSQLSPAFFFFWHWFIPFSTAVTFSRYCYTPPCVDSSRGLLRPENLLEPRKQNLLSTKWA